jgi:hypothetical protein
MTMPNLNSENSEKFFRGLFVGPTGRGKTIAAASWPGETMVEDFDNRHKPIINWYPERVKAGDFTVESITPSNFWTVFKPSINNLVKFNPFQNLILDGITTLSTTSVVMQMLAKGSFDNWFGKKEASAGEEGRGSKITAGGIMVPSWDEFNGEAMIISTLLETLKSLKCNLFVTAHPVARTLIAGKKSSRYYSITTFGPKVESIIPTYFDEVWYFDYKVETDNMGKEIIKRTCYTSPCEDYLEAKTALKLPKEIDYTDRNLYDCIKEYL